jgi:hypothetical protein
MVAALFDDAALFPPGNAPMTTAVPGHRAYRRAGFADLVGPFVAPASRVPELIAALGPGTALDPFEVVLVADSGVLGVEEAVGRLLDEDRVELVGLEVALPRDGDPQRFARTVLDSLHFSVPAAIEIPFVPGWEQALDVLAQDGAERAKFRTGSPDPAAIPSPGQLADAVLAATARRVPFKLTAGLHHALRGAEATGGVDHHGFLNVLAATALALTGAERAELVEVLSSTAAGEVLAPLREADPGPLRAAMRSIGTCSIADPVTDLVGLGLLEPDAA